MTNQLVDIEAAGGICPVRLEKSIELLVIQSEKQGRYRVVGGEEPHEVDLRDPLMPRCDCGDHLWRDKICAHILAALYREGDERVITAVRALVALMREEITALQTVAKRFQIRLTPSLKRTVERMLNRSADEIIYVKNPLTETPHVSVMSAFGGETTGEVLGTITRLHGEPLFTPEYHPVLAAA